MPQKKTSAWTLITRHIRFVSQLPQCFPQSTSDASATKKHGKPHHILLQEEPHDMFCYIFLSNIFVFFSFMYLRFYEVLIVWAVKPPRSLWNQMERKPKLTPDIPSCLAESGVIMRHQMFKGHQKWSMGSMGIGVFPVVWGNKTQQKKHARNILKHYNL